MGGKISKRIMALGFCAIIAILCVEPAIAGTSQDVLARYGRGVPSVSKEEYLAQMDSYLQVASSANQRRVIEMGLEMQTQKTGEKNERALAIVYFLRELEEAMHNAISAGEDIASLEVAYRYWLSELNTISITEVGTVDLSVSFASDEDLEVEQQMLATLQKKYEKSAGLEDIGYTKKIPYPLMSFRLTSNFGYRKDPINGDTRYHYGIDLAAPTGTPVYAILSGYVISVSQSSTGYGNCVVIDHGAGLRTVYAHASKNLVKVNQYVKQGDKIQEVGSTGRSTGPHVHFGVSINGQYVNPATLYD